MGGCLQLEQTGSHCRHFRHFQYLRCPEIHAELPALLTDQDQRQGLVFGFSKDSKSMLLPQVSVPLSESEKPETAVMI